MAGAGADEAAANRELWTRANSEYTDEHAFRAWAAEDIAWGIFNVSEHSFRRDIPRNSVGRTADHDGGYPNWSQRKLRYGRVTSSRTRFAHGEGAGHRG